MEPRQQDVAEALAVIDAFVEGGAKLRVVSNEDPFYLWEASLKWSDPKRFCMGTGETYALAVCRLAHVAANPSNDNA